MLPIILGLGLFLILAGYVFYIFSDEKIPVSVSVKLGGIILVLSWLIGKTI